MELSGFNAQDIRARRMARVHSEDVIHLPEVDVLMTLTPQDANLEFFGDRHVPTLRMSGVMSEVLPQNQMPYDIRSIRFSDRERPVDFVTDYTFTSEQLMSMVEKGLYINGFEMDKDKLIGQSVYMPTTAAIMIVPPTNEEEPPIVSVDVKLPPLFEMNLANSGYDFESELMPDYRAQLLKDQAEAGITPDVDLVREATTDLFADVEMPAFNEEVYGRFAEETIEPDITREFADVVGYRMLSPSALEKVTEDLDLDRPGVTLGKTVEVDGQFGHAASEFFAENIAASRKNKVDERLARFRGDEGLDSLDGVDLDDLGDIDIDTEDTDGEDTSTTTTEGEKVGYVPVGTETGMSDHAKDAEVVKPGETAPGRDDSAHSEEKGEDSYQTEDIFADVDDEVVSSAGETAEEKARRLEINRKAERARQRRAQQINNNLKNSASPSVGSIAPTKKAEPTKDSGPDFD